ncbi:MAG TPA: hypothetical protein VFL10_06605 [Ornithinibacter sp.]|nr:hypothetical protein [Ornithinibacter sp.]
MHLHPDVQHMATDRRGRGRPGAARFNTTGFSRWVNGPNGRVFRLLAGASFLLVALTFRGHWWGVAAGVWSFFPLSAGLFDLCWISAALGGPLSGRAIRAGQAVRNS